MNRKEFISNTSKAMAGVALAAPIIQASSASGTPIRAIAFDAYTLFDTSTLVADAERLFPGRGKELMAAWRTRQFEYTWLRSLSKNYKNFYVVTEDALVYATALLQLNASAEARKQLMQSFLQMHFVADAKTSLQQLKDKGIKLAILSNATPGILQAGISNSGMGHIFDFVLSTDSIKTYKPDPAAYQMGVDAFKLKKEEILFVAFGGWDEAGAKYFGYPTVWINAGGLPVEQLDVQPDYVCKSLTEMAAYALARS